MTTMGMADLRRAFDEGLAGKASCVNATMGYEKGAEQGQRLRFNVHLPNGETQIVEGLAPHGSNLNDQARQMAATFAATL